MDINFSDPIVILSIGLIVLFIIIIILIVSISKTNSRLKKLTRGNKMSIEDSLFQIQDQLDENEKFKEELEEYLVEVEKRLRTSIRGLDLSKFDAFKGTGLSGKQSFASCFLNEEGDGIIISAIHSRDRVSVYAKPIKAGKSEFDLSEEERASLTNAQKSCNL